MPVATAVPAPIGPTSAADAASSRLRLAELEAATASKCCTT